MGGRGLIVLTPFCGGDTPVGPEPEPDLSRSRSGFDEFGCAVEEGRGEAARDWERRAGEWRSEVPKGGAGTGPMPGPEAGGGRGLEEEGLCVRGILPLDRGERMVFEPEPCRE